MLRLKWDAAAGTERRLDRADETLTGSAETRIRCNLAFATKTPLGVENMQNGCKESLHSLYIHGFVPRLQFLL
jgi:hypothetical protein